VLGALGGRKTHLADARKTRHLERATADERVTGRRAEQDEWPATTNSTRDDSSDTTELAINSTAETTLDEAEIAPILGAAGTEAAPLDGDLGDPALHTIARALQEPAPTRPRPWRNRTSPPR
jgi:hypothetical protein